jgi:hypothetical protein
MKLGYSSLMDEKETPITIIKNKNARYLKLIWKLKKDEQHLFNEAALQLPADKNEAEYKINRLFLDKEKPKNWTIICELLSIYNTIKHQNKTA